MFQAALHSRTASDCGSPIKGGCVGLVKGSYVADNITPLSRIKGLNSLKGVIYGMNIGEYHRDY